MFPLSFKEFWHFKAIPTTSFLESDKAKLKKAFGEFNHASAFPEVVLLKEQSLKSKNDAIKALYQVSWDIRPRNT